MILLGGVIYCLALKGALSLSGMALSKGDYNSLDRMRMLNMGTILPMIAGAYRDYFARVFYAYSSYPSILVKAMTAVFCVIDIAALAVAMGRRKLLLRNKLLCACLVLLLPLGSNMIYVLTSGGSHDLMVYPICLFYLLTLLLAGWLFRWCKDNTTHAFIVAAGEWQRVICVLLIGACMYGNVRFSNGMYMKKNLEFDANLSLMTRIVGRMEMAEGYEPGQTPVVFVGLPKIFNKVIPGFKDYWNVTGMTGSSTIYTTEPSRIQAYFDYILSVPIQLADWETSNEILSLDEVRNMPYYPTDGFMRYFGDTLVVKLGNVSD